MKIEEFPSSVKPASGDPLIILKNIFGYANFRPFQERVIQSVLAKKNTLLVMPTGGGKSLCYQIPSLIFEGTTLVVSPLISLMQDQVSQLKELGVEAECLNSSLSQEEYRRNKRSIISGKTKILFLAPETVLKEETLVWLKDLKLDCVTLDEAHCISEWGHDFRPEYRQLARLQSIFPRAAWLALTATATPRVQRDIVANLEMKNPLILVASFNRTNLFYEVIPKQKPFAQTLDFIRRFRDQSGIIYCFSRKQVDDLTGQLNKEGIRALPYHAGLPDQERKRNQELFIRDDVGVMVATIAFGLGINKPNVRFIVHYDLPKNIESYYQETGRAGRDGLPAHCLLLLSYGDISKIKFFIAQKTNLVEKRISQMHLDAMVRFAESEICRRKILLGYFGEEFGASACGLCDNCLHPKTATFDLTLPAKKILAAVLRTGQRFGAHYVIDVLRGVESEKILGYEHNELDIFGAGKEFNLRQWQFIIRQLIQKGFLSKEIDRFGVLKLNSDSFLVLKNQTKIQGFPPPAVSQKEKVVSQFKSPKPEYEDEKLFDLLRKKRKQLADEKNVPPYVIFPDKSLVEMSRLKPRDKTEMARIFGVGEKKLEAYADDFIAVVRLYIEKND